MAAEENVSLDLEQGKCVGNGEQSHAASFVAKMSHQSPSMTGNVLLHVADWRLAIVSTHGIQLAIECDRLKGTSTLNHGFLFGPAVRCWIVRFARTESTFAIIAANSPNATTIERH